MLAALRTLTEYVVLQSRAPANQEEKQSLLEKETLRYGGFQAGESSQMPPKLFPGSLASYCLVFQMDEEWHGAELYPRRPAKGSKEKAPDVSSDLA